MFDNNENFNKFKNKDNDITLRYEKNEKKPLIFNLIDLLKVVTKTNDLEQEKLDLLAEKKFRNSINLTKELNEWYKEEEIKIAEGILEELFKNYSRIKKLSNNELLSAIDYALSEIYQKKITQKQIAERHNISVYKLREARTSIAPFILIKFFYKLFLSDEEINSNKEKTYIFKVNSNYFKNYWSKLELLESQTLDVLHEVIQQIMEFNNYFKDHLYSFFMSGKIWDSDTQYSVPSEYQEYCSAKKTTSPLKELNLGYTQRFLYLYDFGECLKYTITVIGIGIYHKNKKYPYIVQ